MMRPLRVVRGIRDITGLFLLAFILPVLVTLVYEPWTDETFGARLPPSLAPFLAAAATVALVWVVLTMMTRRTSTHDMLDKEAYLVVGLGWIMITLLGSLPFLYSGVLPAFWDAFFESMSGITTTGASALQVPVESVPAGVLFWRAWLQWIGGLGIIVLFVAALSRLTQGAMTLFQAEASGHMATRIRPTLVATARTLWRLYTVITVLMVLVFTALMARIGLPWKTALYDGTYHAFTTLSTGGFSSRTGSIGWFSDPWIETATIVFMLVGATNFALLLRVREGEWRALVKDPQWRLLMSVFAVATVLVVIVLWWDGVRSVAIVRAAAFAVTTALTGTGLVTAADFGFWPPAALVVLLMLMLMGGNAGSTSGAIKSGRFLILGKVVAREIRRLLHPRAVIPLRVGQRTFDERAVYATIAFFFAYLTTWVLGTVLVAAFEPDLSVVDIASATASTLGNVGVGLGQVGPSGGYAMLSVPSKVVLTGLMWLGRLEIFTALLLFKPESWKD